MKRLISTVLVACAVFGAVGYLAFSSLPVAAEGSAAFSTVPRKNYTVEPGKTVNDTLVIRNIDSELPLYLSLRVVDFENNDETGIPKLLLDEDEPQKPWSLKPFLKLPESVTVEPNSTKTIDLSVTMPKEYKAGSYYSAIVYSSGSSEGGNVGLSASLTTLVFANIPGEVDEKLTLEKLGAYDPGLRKYSYFNAEKPKRIGYTVRNEGNVVGSPAGTITLKNWFGHEVTINNINPNGNLALIGQTRVFDTCIKQKSQEYEFKGDRTEAPICVEPDLWPGYYSVELDAYYSFIGGNATKDLDGKAGFWYLPWWFVLLVLAVLSYISFHTWRLVRYIKRRKNGVKLKSRQTRNK